MKKFFLSIILLFSINAHSKVGFGSGFLVSSDGYLVTNYHVVKDAVSVKIKVNSIESSLEARVIRSDIRNDLAILKIEGANYKYINIKPSTNIKRGEKVYAIGFPHVGIQGIEPKLTDGIISSLSGLRDEPATFQITNPIQPGNSGGPLFTEDGEVVGVVVATLNALSVANQTGTIPQNVNFAIKSNYLIELLNGVNSVKLKPNYKSNFSRPKKFVDIVGDVEKSVVLIFVSYSSVAGLQENVKPKAVEKSPKAQQESKKNEQQNSANELSFLYRGVTFATVSNGVVVLKNAQESKNTFQVGDVIASCYLNKDAIKYVKNISDISTCLSLGLNRFKTLDNNGRWFFE